MKKITSPTSGLFIILPKYPITWLKHTIKDIKIFFERLYFGFSHGYYPQANWETFSYMIQMWKEILTTYRYERAGTSCIIPLPEDTNPNDEEWLAENEAAYNEYLDAMLADLEIMEMDLLDSERSYAETAKLQQEAADDFFQRMSKIFFTLWD